ncbi:hypothetical protein Tco_0117597 [Tanacetum coccineum]
MEAVVQQYHVDKQCFEIQKKQFLIENDRILDQIISKDIVNIVVNSSLDKNTSVNVNSSVAMNDSVNYVNVQQVSRTLKEIVEQAKSLNPLDSASYSAYLEEEPAPTGDQFGPSALMLPKIAKQMDARRNQGKSSNSASQNLAFLSSENTSSTNKVSTASGDFGISTTGGINQVSSTLCAHDMDGDDLEELDLRWQVAMLTVRVKKGHFARECRSGRNQGRRSYGDNGRSNAPTNESSSQVLVAQDGLGYDWSNDFEVEPVNYALMAISSSSSSNSSESEKYEFQNYELKCREIKINNLNMELEKVVKERDELKDKITKWEESTKNLDEILNSQMSARDKTGLGYNTQLNELSNNHETDSENSLSIFDGQTNAEKPKSTSESVVSNPKINRDRVIIEDWNLDDEEEEYEVQIVRPKTQTVQTRDDKSGQNSNKQGIGFRKVKACFVCKSTNHLIKDCNFHDKKSQEPKLKNVVNTGQREGKPVWDNTKRINHQNFSKYPHLSNTFVPLGVLTRTGLHRLSVSTTRPVCTARPSVSIARLVCIDRPSGN